MTALPHRYLPTLLLTLAIGLSGCTTVVTPQAEESAGSAMSKEVEDQIGLYHDPELSAYLNAVGQRLAAELGDTPYTFRFHIVDQAEPNAFASPGGYIYVSRGLLTQFNSEAELAGVLAHEISHVTQRHHTRQAGRSLGAGLLTLPGRAVGVVSQDLGNMINAPIEYAGKVYLSSYSRGQETEADEYGMRLAAAAGYDPLALGDALQGIENVIYALTGEQHEATFFDTHPTTPTRVADIQRQASGLQVAKRPPLANQAQLLAHLDGIWWGPQNPQQGVFDDEVFRSVDMNFTVTFPGDWKTINTPRFVGASEPEGGAYLALGSNTGEGTPAEYGAALVQRMQEKAGLKATIDRSFDIGDWPAHVVRYDDNSGPETVSLYYVFVQSPSDSYAFMAMGLLQHREAMRKAVMSLRPMTAAERNKVGGLRLRVTDLQPGESLEAMATRVGNKWPENLTRAMNGMQQVEPGATKFVRPEVYRPGQ